MICDWDDFCEDNHRLDLLGALKAANPEFRCTLFSIPARGSDSFWQSVPDWCELVPHGWLHPTPVEARDWSRGMAEWVLDQVHPRFVQGWKSPGWQVSDETYEVLLERGYWIADQHYNDYRRPEGLRVHCLDDGNHLHGHIQDIGSNGLVESWDETLRRVQNAESFELISEVVEPWSRHLVTV